MKTLCIYHGNCADGFGAAWAVRQALGDGVEFYAGVHQDPPPDVANRNVLLVDFSYKRGALIELARSAATVLVVDHHKSAAEDLQEFRAYPYRRGYGHDPVGIAQTAMETGTYAIETVFDMERSGAGLAWDLFHTGPRPALIDHIEDRDLWRFKLPGTREIQAALFSYPYDFEAWDELMRADTRELYEQGVAIERKHHKDVAELVAVCKRRVRIGGHVVNAASLPYTLTSDAGHLMAHGEPFAVCYWDTPQGRVFSLRSTEQGLDVSEIAKQYGGGGHRNASGFRVPFDVAATFEIAP